MLLPIRVSLIQRKAIVALLATIALTCPVFADDEPTDLTETPAVVKSNEPPAAKTATTELDARVRRLVQEELKKGEGSRAKDAEKKPAAPTIDLTDKKWTLKVGGHVQMDFIHWANADAPPIPAQDYFEFRRLRMLVDGTGYGVFDFRFQLDIEP